MYELQILRNTGANATGRNFLQSELEVASNSIAAYREPTVIRPPSCRDNVTMMLVPELEEFAGDSGAAAPIDHRSRSNACCASTTRWSNPVEPVDRCHCDRTYSSGSDHIH